MQIERILRVNSDEIKLLIERKYNIKIKDMTLSRWGIKAYLEG